MLTNNLKKVLQAFKEKFNLEVDAKLSAKLNNTFIEKPNRILTTDSNGKVFIKDVGQQQLDYIANVSSDVQAQLDRKPELDHLHPNYATKEELNVVAGKDASAIVFDSPTDSFESTNVQDALEETNSKIDSTINNHNNDIIAVNSKISDNSKDILNLQGSYLNKDRLGVDIAQLENGKLKIVQLPAHTHSDYVEHTHIEFDTFASKDSLSNTDKLLREHNHDSRYSKLGHTHQDIIDMIEDANVEGELASLQSQITDNKSNISRNALEINDLSANKSDKTHTHSQFSDLQEQIDNIELAATQHSHQEFSELQSAINDNKSTINALGNVYAAKSHDHDDRYDARYSSKAHTHDANDLLDGVLPELDKKYAPTIHIHSQYSDSTHDHDSRYAKIVHSHTGEFAPTNHDHSDYAFKIHDHQEFITLDTKINTKANKTEVYTKDEMSAIVDAKADSIHNHNYSDLLDIPAEFNPASHTHSTGDINELRDYVISVANEIGVGGGATAYPILPIEGSYVTNELFPYGHICRYGGQQFVDDGQTTPPTVTNNHTAIHNSMAVWNYVYIPKGTWIISSPIKLTTSGAYIQGEGIYKTVLRFTKADVRIEMLESYQRFEHFEIRGLNDIEIDYGFYSINKTLNGLYFNSVEVRNVKLSGLYTNSTITGDSYFIDFRVLNSTLNNAAGIKANTLVTVLIRGGRFWNLNSGINSGASNTTAGSRTLITDAVFIGCTYGIRIYNVPAKATMLIKGCKFRTCTTGIYTVTTSYNVQVVANMFLAGERGINALTTHRLSSTSNVFSELTAVGIENKSSALSGNTKTLVSTGDIFDSCATAIKNTSVADVRGF